MFTKLGLADARAGLAFYARAIEGIQAAKQCARLSLPAAHDSINSLKLPSSDLFLALADHVGKLSEEAEEAQLDGERSDKDVATIEPSLKAKEGQPMKSNPSAPVKNKPMIKGHSRIASLPESLAAPKTAILKTVGKAFRHM